MAKVVLHIYDVSTDPNIGEVNKILSAIGTGAFHGAVEVYGKEWSYGYADRGSGVFCCEPKGCTAHKYRESVPMGETRMNPQEAGRLIERLMDEWQGPDYDLLRRNCVLFSDALCQGLGVGSVPPWVKNLAGAGASLQDGAKQAQAAAIIAAARAGEINEKYQISNKASEAISQGATQAALLAAKAQTKYVELDKEYKLQARATDAAVTTHAKASLLAMQASRKASELDEQYKVQENALNAANQAWAKINEMNERYRVKEQAGALFSGLAAAAGQGLARAQEGIQQAQQQGRTQGTYNHAAPGPVAQDNRRKEGECNCEACIVQ